MKALFLALVCFGTHWLAGLLARGRSSSGGSRFHVRLQSVGAVCPTGPTTAPAATTS